MQITINTADDERRTFEMLTWFDWVAPPPKPRRRPFGGCRLRQAAPPECCAQTREEPSGKVGVPWWLLQSHHWPPGRRWQVCHGNVSEYIFLSCCFTDWKEKPSGLKIYRRCSAQGNKKIDRLGRKYNLLYPVYLGMGCPEGL